MKHTLGTICLAALLLVALPAFAQTETCGDTERMAFMADVEAGMPWEDLEAMYGPCRTNASTETKIMVNTFTGSVWYEQLNSCGYHPQNETVFCDVEVKLPTYYGPFPTGSLEYVLYCLDCNLDGAWDFQTLGSVHVTDDISGGPFSFYFNAAASTMTAPPMCTVNDGLNTNVRAILSWVAMPAGCNFIPVWGNQIDFTARRDP